MRWPFRRKDADSTIEPASPATPAEAPAASVGTVATAGAVVRPPARQWATLPAIPVTITRTAPLIVGPAPVLPPLRTGGRGSAAPEVAPALGRVTGLARPAAPVAEDVAPRQLSEPVELVPAPAVRRPARALPDEVPTLTDAVDEYVGEPREPAEPHRAPGFLRYAPTWLLPGEPMIPGLPAPTQSEPDVPMGPPPSFLPPELRSEPAPRPELPPRMAEVRREELAPAPVRKRRANLGQSRRLGLGAPISPADGEPLVHPDEPPHIVEGAVAPPALPAPPAPHEEPPPAPAAPPRSVSVDLPAPSAPPASPPPPAPPIRSDATDSDEDDSGGGGSTPPPAPVPPLLPTTRPTEPRKRAAAAVYRATPELRPAPRRRELPRATVVSAVPADLANAVRSRQQADVSTVPVYRGPKVSAAASARGARAFASGGAVFLPDEAGPVDSPKARGLLAHELVHALQQRTLGAMLPAPDSAHGQELEAEAQTAERYYSGESGAEEPAPLIHAPLAAPAPVVEQREPDLTAAAQLATALAAAPTPAAAPAQPLHSPFDAPTRAEVGKIAEVSAKHVVEEWTNPKLAKKEKEAGGEASGGEDAAASGPAAAGKTPAGKTPAAKTAATTTPTASREVLVAAALARLNDARAPGDPEVTTLPADEEAAIDRQLGGTGASTEPAAQHYEKNSAKAWTHAITGMNANYGLGLNGWKAEPGSEESWFSGVKDERNAKDRVLDGLGIANAETTSQFDMDSWYQSDTPAKDADGATDAAATSTDQPAQREDYIFGRKNPDQSTVDMSKIDMDELASRLYDRVRSRLRLELLVDRERAGQLTDFR
jgi:hypothetical protein